jgi:hypothetical protein
MSDDPELAEIAGLPDDDDETDSAYTKAVAEGVRRILTMDRASGDILPWGFLLDALGLPDYRQANDVDAYERGRLRFLSLRKGMEKALLLHHNIAFRTIIGTGVQIVPPSEQTAWAAEEMNTELRRTMSKASARLRHVKVDALTAEEKTANTDALAKHATLRSMFRAQQARDRQRG